MLLLSCSQLSRSFDAGPLFEDLGFELYSGQRAGLVGPNGVGKTTLMRILAGQEFPSAGSITVLRGSPVKDDHLLHRMVFVREDQHYTDYRSPSGRAHPAHQWPTGVVLAPERLGRGSVTNHAVPAANTMAEWNTTSPATTRARMRSSSGRRGDRAVTGKRLYRQPLASPDGWPC